jgi:hypothetical protein
LDENEPSHPLPQKRKSTVEQRQAALAMRVSQSVKKETSASLQRRREENAAAKSMRMKEFLRTTKQLNL